ncbi:MAG: lysozyme [Rickettsiales bacterium]|nr:lysozyme [Rickettsiales bacterium]
MESIIGILGISALTFGLNKLGYIDLPNISPRFSAPRETYSDSITIDDFGLGAEPGQNIRLEVSQLSLTAQGLEFIKSKEGFSSGPYQDSAGVWTIGYGTTGDVYAYSAPVTVEQATNLMSQDLEQFHRELVALVNVPLKQNEYDALMSFIYNLGAHNLAGSTLLRKLNAGDYEAAAGQLTRWVYAGGTRIAGLVKRRKEEQATFLA